MHLTSFSAGFTNAPRWSPDGKQIVFAAVQNSNRDIYIVSPDGGSPATSDHGAFRGRQTELVAGWPLDLLLLRLVPDEQRSGRSPLRAAKSFR